MGENREALPFGLKDLKEVEVVYTVQPGKSGAGSEEIRITGQGNVTLSRKAAYNSEPVVLTGRITEDLLITLLEFFESADFLGMDEQYEGTEPLQGSRTVFLRIGTREHSVAQIGGGPTPASQFVGAIKLAAGTAVGEAVRGTFFRYM